MNQALETIEFTIFDTETTGLEALSGDRIVEIAAIRFKASRELAVFQALVNPGRAISEAAFQVNRITQDMLRDAPDSRAIMPKFLDFIQGSCLCSYNAGFDLEFLNNEFRLIGQEPLRGIVVVDILKMARRLLPSLGRYTLLGVAGSLGLEFKQEHRALADVQLTLGVFRRLKKILEAQGITDFTHFSNLFTINVV